ncbi:type II toxin-antitoxin system HicA family toxin [Clostridium sp.]|uniref:type II toxin-antitoxin system HicA family toxin n=1 Tax=Clostridium sp. TaxID=1506 RepID=UPI002FC65FE9
MVVVGFKEYGFIKESHLKEVQLNEVLKKFQILLGNIYNETFIKVGDELREYYEFIKKELDSYVDEVLEFNEKMKSIPSIETRQKLNKITDKEKMKKFMEDEGYSIDRHNGDHAIYQNEDGHTVPVRDIGKGLSYAIQKQVLCS